MFTPMSSDASRIDLSAVNTAVLLERTKVATAVPLLSELTDGGALSFSSGTGVNAAVSSDGAGLVSDLVTSSVEVDWATSSFAASGSFGVDAPFEDGGGASGLLEKSSSFTFSFGTSSSLSICFTATIIGSGPQI